MWQAILTVASDARIRAVAVALLLLGFTYASTIPYQPIIAMQQLGMSERQFGALILVVGVTGLIGGLTLGYLSDIARNRKTAVLCCFVVGAVGFGGFALWPNLPTFLVCMLLVYPVSGSAYSLLFGTVRSLSNELAPKEAGSVNAAVRSFYAFSWIVVPGLVGAIIALTSRASDSFAIAAIAFAFCLIFFSRFGPDVAGSSAPAGSALANLREALRLIVHPKRLTRLAAVSLVNSAHPLTAAAFPLILTQQVHGTTAQLGFFAGLVAALEIPIMLGVGASVRRYPVWLVIVAGGVVHAAFLLALVPATNVFMLYAIAVLNAIANAVLLTQHITYAQDLLPDRPGLGSSLLSVISLISRAAAALVFGGIGIAYGLNGALVAGAFLCIAGCAGVVLLARRPTA